MQMNNGMKTWSAWILFALLAAIGAFGMFSWVERSSSSVAYIVQVSADGRSLYYCRDGKGRELVSYDLATGKSSVIATTSTLVFPYVQLSKDNGWIGVVYADNARGQIYRLGSDLRLVEKLVNSPYSDTLPMRHADGASFVFVRAHRGRTDAWGGNQWTDLDLYSLDCTSKKVVRLTNMLAKDFSRPAVSPDGRSIAFSARSRHEDDRVYLATTKPGSARQLSLGRTTYGDPTLSSDGKRIAIVTDRSVEYKYEVWTMATDGTDLKQITSINRRCGSPVFLPGDKSLVFIVDEKELWRINADGSELKRIE
jgi:Tol biopolymer transport system component